MESMLPLGLSPLATLAITYESHQCGWWVLQQPALLWFNPMEPCELFIEQHI